MLGNFKSNQPLNNFLLLIYGLLLKWPLFAHSAVPAYSPADSYLYRQLVFGLAEVFRNIPVGFGILVFLLHYFQALILNDVVNQQKLYAKPNHLTAMCYLLFTSVFSTWFVFSPVLLCMSLLIWILSRLCKLQNHTESNKTFFNMGLVLGLSVLLYFPNVIFLLLILLSFLIIRPFRLPEWIITILGILTPVYFLWSALFLLKQDTRSIYPVLGVGVPHFNLTSYETSAMVIILITVSIGFVFIQNNMLKLLVQSRKSWVIFYFFLFFALVLPFLNADSGMQFCLPLIIPFSVIGTSAFYYPGKRWFPVFSHWSLFLLAMVIGYYFMR